MFLVVAQPMSHSLCGRIFVQFVLIVALGSLNQTGYADNSRVKNSWQLKVSQQAVASSLIHTQSLVALDSATPKIPLHTLLDLAVTLPDMEKVSMINHFFNRFKNRSDATLWGVNEYWATPDELLRQNAGDCEDIAVAKYVYLIQVGIPESNLRLSYAKLLNRRSLLIENHLVLLYKNNSGQEFVLDNVERTLLPIAARSDLTFQFAFNQHAVWSLNQSITATQITRSGIYASWRNVLTRIKSQEHSRLQL